MCFPPRHTTLPRPRHTEAHLGGDRRPPRDAQLRHLTVAQRRGGRHGLSEADGGGGPGRGASARTGAAAGAWEVGVLEGRWGGRVVWEWD